MKKKHELSPWEHVILNRIRSLIDVQCNGSQKKFVDMTGLNKGSVSQYVNGKNVPSWENAEKIADAFHIDVNWVMAVDIIPEGLSDEEIARRDSKAQELLTLYENANPEIQKAVMLLLESARQDS